MKRLLTIFLILLPQFLLAETDSSKVIISEPQRRTAFVSIGMLSVPDFLSLQAGAQLNKEWSVAVLYSIYFVAGLGVGEGAPMSSDLFRGIRISRHWNRKFFFCLTMLVFKAVQ